MDDTKIGIIGDSGRSSDVILFPSSPRQAKEEIEEYNLQTTNEGSDKVIFFRVISREEFFNLLESAE